MSYLFMYILGASVMCSLCGTAALMLNRMVRGVSQRFRCDILTLALILPALGILLLAPRYNVIAVTISEPIYISADHSAEEAAAPDSAGGEAAAPAVSGNTDSAAAPGSASREETPQAPVIPGTNIPLSVICIVNTAAWIWLAGALGMFVYSVIRQARLMLILRRERKLLSQPGKLSVYSVNMNISPFLAGYFRPAVYVPADTYDDDELALVIAHETAHYRRGDLYRRLLMTLLACVNWFNPVYHILLKKLSAQTEYACDEAVTRGADEETNKLYGSMLLRTAEKRSGNSYLAVGLGSSAAELKSRIEAFMDKNKKLSRITKAAAIGTFTLTAVLCAGGCAMTSLAAAAVSRDPSAVTYITDTHPVIPDIEFDIKDGYYVSSADNSYIHIYDGYVELVGYDFAAALPSAYEEGVEAGIIDPEKNSYERFYDDSVKGFIETSKPRKYVVKAFPAMGAGMLVTEMSETEQGGGSYSGYGIIDDNILTSHGDTYIYAGTEKP